MIHRCLTDTIQLFPSIAFTRTPHKNAEGNLKNKIAFTSPASALLITAAYEKDDAVYFVGSSTKSKKSLIDIVGLYSKI